MNTYNRFNDYVELYDRLKYNDKVIGETIDYVKKCK